MVCVNVFSPVEIGMKNTILKTAPYGLADYESLREQALAYVDKTQFIEELEKLKIFHPSIHRSSSPFWKNAFYADS